MKPIPTILPTRQRLLTEGIRLFAANGFSATSVGEIEAAAGLQPRRGALYRHFTSKEALLEAAVAAHRDEIRKVKLEMTQLSADPRAIAEAFVRWLLVDLDAQRDLTRILEHDGARLPALRDAFRASSDAGFRAAAEVLRRWPAMRDRDPEATAVLLVGAVVNYRRSAWTLGATPLEVGEERLVPAYVDLVMALIQGPSARD